MTTVGFVLGKLAWLVLKPGNLLFLLLAGAVLLQWRRLALAILLVLAGLTLLPAGQWLGRPLEDRFQRPDAPPARVDGIIVLGGAQEQHITTSRDVLALGHAGERLIEGFALALRYPEARLVFAGRSGVLGERGGSEQEVNTRFVALVRLDEGRVVYEDRSRTTWENAVFSRELVAPRPDETWLLVTSAIHMPRAVGIFRRVGWPVLPWPVDYQSTKGLELPSTVDVAQRLVELDRAVREWLGLLAYRLMDRTDALLPEP